MKDLAFIYEKLKNTYDLTLTNTAALNSGYTIDVPVIRGIGNDRLFDLYKDDDLFVFCGEFIQKDGADKYSGIHPHNIDSAIALIEEFMDAESITTAKESANAQK